MSRQGRFLLPFSILLALGLTALAFLLLDSGRAGAPADEAVFPGCSPEEAATQAVLAAIPSPTPFGPDISSAFLNQPEVHPTFTGTLCGFEFVATEDEARPTTYCEGELSFVGGPDATSPLVFLDSELNQEEQTEQVICDGTPIATYSLEGRASYFYGAPRLFVGETPRERMRVTRVDDYPVLVLTPKFNPGTFFYYAVKRPASANRPGILLVGGFAFSFEDAIAKARTRLSD